MFQRSNQSTSGGRPKSSVSSRRTSGNSGGRQLRRMDTPEAVRQAARRVDRHRDAIAACPGHKPVSAPGGVEQCPCGWKSVDD